MLLDAMHSGARLSDLWARQLETRLAWPVSFEFRSDPAPSIAGIIFPAKQD